MSGAQEHPSHLRRPIISFCRWPRLAQGLGGTWGGQVTSGHPSTRGPSAWDQCSPGCGGLPRCRARLGSTHRASEPLDHRVPLTLWAGQRGPGRGPHLPAHTGSARPPAPETPFRASASPASGALLDPTGPGLAPTPPRPRCPDSLHLQQEVSPAAGVPTAAPSPEAEDRGRRGSQWPGILSFPERPAHSPGGFKGLRLGNSWSVTTPDKPYV